MSTNQTPTPGLVLTMPASFPGAAKHLEHVLGKLVEKCRPGYCVSKGVRAQINECRAVASATVFAIEHQPPAYQEPPPLLVRDLAELLDTHVPAVCMALVELGYPPRSTNMAVGGEEAVAVMKHLRP